MNILQEALEEMPKKFDSKTFYAKFSKQFDRNDLKQFLEDNCNKSKSRGKWLKRMPQDVRDLNVGCADVFTKWNNDESISNAIELLKSKGYKVMKKVVEYVEI